MADFLPFADKHRIQVDFVVAEAGDHLTVGPARTRVYPLALSLYPFFASILLFKVGMDGGPLSTTENRFVAALCVVIPSAMIAIVRAIYRHEFAKGPVLAVDRGDGLVSLPRDGRRLAFDAVAGVVVLSGDYRWISGEVDQVAELSLLVDGPGGGVEVVPVVMVLNGVERLEATASRVAAWLDIPPGRPAVAQQPGRKQTTWAG